MKMKMKMKKVSSSLTFFIYALSLPILATSIWLFCTRDYDCEDLLRMPPLRVVVAVGLLVIFVVSNGIALCGGRAVIPGLLVLVVPLMLLLMLGLALVGAYNMESRAVPGSPMWLRIRVGNPQIWDNIKTCLFDTKICTDLAYRTLQLTSYDFSMMKLSPIEAGCCKPPDLCGMVYVNATYWNAAGDSGGEEEKNEVDPSFSDCTSWSNDINELCYDCKACKVGYLTAIQRRWKELGAFLMVMSLLILVSHAASSVVAMLAKHKA